MGRTYFGNNDKVKLWLGNKKVLSMWYGNIRVYPNAGAVTYYVDSNKIYTEEIDIDESCLSPTTFVPTKDGWTFIGWKENTTADSNVLSEKISDGNNYTLYAVFRQNITVTKYNGSSSATTETKPRYYNNANVNNPSFTLSQNGVSGWSAIGWTTTNSATGGINVNNGGTVTLSANATYYGRYQQTITLSYNGNGATGGSTSNQTGTRNWNSVSYSNPSFILRNNGFSRTNYSFQKWAMGSASGTQYSAGATVTLSASTTFYAVWLQTQYIISSINLTRYSDWGGNGNGSSWSESTVSGNTIGTHFWNCSYRTHIVEAYAGSWNASGFTKCTVQLTPETITTSNIWQSYTVGVGSSAGSSNLGSYTKEQASGGSQSITFNITSSSTAYFYIKYTAWQNNNYDREFSTSITINQITFHN